MLSCTCVAPYAAACLAGYIILRATVHVRQHCICLVNAGTLRRAFRVAVSQNREGGPKIFTAEDWITDKEAYNRKGTKLLKSTGKFRFKTIDLKDILFSKADETLSDFNK